MSLNLQHLAIETERRLRAERSEQDRLKAEFLAARRHASLIDRGRASLGSALIRMGARVQGTGRPSPTLALPRA